MRDSLTTAAEVVGVGCIAAAGFMVAFPLGLFALGVGLIGVSMAVSR